jgi:hypothetical protein
MQDLVWSNLPWDFNLSDDVLVEGMNYGWEMGNAKAGEGGQMNEDAQTQQSETLGMSIL